MKFNTLADENWMQYAFRLAQKAESNDEIPVGAILVLDGQIIGEGYNQSILQKDPTAHAEMIALRTAGQRIGNHRLLGSTLYVTLEPCLMCVGALLHGRIKHIVFGASSPKFGAIISQHFLLENLELTHRITWEGGCLNNLCSDILKDFFLHRRS